MLKKKKNKLLCLFFKFKISWLPALIIGIGIGIASQHILEIREHTEELILVLSKKLPVKQIPYHPTVSSPLAGMPISQFYINRHGYSLAYDARNRNPLWVYEHLTTDNINGNVDRSHFDFKEDESIPHHLRATLIDYRSQGFDRGHMAPAADHRSDELAMNDTFYLTNMCPQCPQFNRGYWQKLERHVRDLTKVYPHVYVVTGPLYLPYKEVDGKRYVKYQLIGQNDVAVPTHFFKVITVEDRQGHIDTQAYVLPNAPIHSSIQLDSFKTTVQKVEHLAGILFSHTIINK